MSGSRIFIDSNIFLYAFNNDDNDKQKEASKIITDNKNSLIISIQVINEVSNNMIKKLFFTNFEVKDFITDSYGRFEVRNPTKEMFVEACDIREKYNLSYYDSLIVSTALESRCTILYSEDMQHNQKIDTLTIINPFRD